MMHPLKLALIGFDWLCIGFDWLCIGFVLALFLLA